MMATRKAILSYFGSGGGEMSPGFGFTLMERAV